MRVVPLIVLTLALGACGPAEEGSPAQTPEAAPALPNAAVTPSELGGVFATVEAADAVDGRPPELTFVCGEGKTPGLQLDLVTPPETPSPLRGVFGSFTLDGGAPQQIEMAWTGLKARWQPRTDDDKAAGAAFARAVVAADRIEFTPPATYAPAGPIRWTTASLGARLGEVRTLCGAASPN